MELTAVYYQTEGWWVGYVIEIPGVNTQGRSIDEARAGMSEAVELALEARKHLGLPEVQPVIQERIRFKAS
jgi:predicted RNase H-like HicB family nuclease